MLQGSCYNRVYHSACTHWWTALWKESLLSAPPSTYQWNPLLYSRCVGHLLGVLPSNVHVRLLACAHSVTVLKSPYVCVCDCKDFSVSYFLEEKLSYWEFCDGAQQQIPESSQWLWAASRGGVWERRVGFWGSWTVNISGRDWVGKRLLMSSWYMTSLITPTPTPPFFFLAVRSPIRCHAAHFQVLTCSVKSKSVSISSPKKTSATVFIFWLFYWFKPVIQDLQNK